jgi:16S rRNA (uracil1498-N3)-methyltransferase
MQLFYLDTPGTGIITLSEEESGHAIRVMRLQAGSHIHLVDGQGGFYEARITDAHAKKCKAEVLSRQEEFGKQPYSIHLAIAPTKNSDRNEWMVEKAVEIGVNEITFLLTDRTERRQLKTDRLEKIAMSAMKQSIKAYLPRINGLVAYSKFINTERTCVNYIAHLAEGERHSLVRTAQPKQDYCILIGPEGDFTPEEVTSALQNRFLPVTLGTHRLRTETAGIVACTILNQLNEV